MTREIKQSIDKINTDDVIARKFYPVWFFTNERMASFLPALAEEQKIKKIFAIGGTGDFIFSLLSALKGIESADVCDNRPLSSLTIDLKIALLNNFSRQNFIELFSPNSSLTIDWIYEKIKNNLSQASQDILKFIMDRHKNDRLLPGLKKSKLWYNYSFRQMQNRLEYLPYLSDDQAYQALQKRLNKINICFGDLRANLNLCPDNSYDLIYISNIFDHKSYCAVPEKYLTTIKNKLSTGGACLAATQDPPQKLIELFSAQSFILAQESSHHFNILDAVFSRLNYSFLLFKK
ncbi:MAG: hypothetical protein NTY61_01205 [Candidatus Parcubacteria bacterium]|nr:hypothetical protein [Candidatus Parcubacteria bacterium]